jgi:hypothetical protein
MKMHLLAAAALLTIGASGAMAQDGAAAGAATGAIGGAVVGGPVGAVVGGVAGAAIGGIAEADRPRFRTYVEQREVRPYRYEGDVRVGVTLPSDGVQYYEVPAEYRVSGMRYTVVNGRTVLVEPRSRRIVQVIE